MRPGRTRVCPVCLPLWGTGVIYSNVSLNVCYLQAPSAPSRFREGDRLGGTAGKTRHTMKKRIVHTLLGLAVVLFAAAAAGVELENLKGRIVGQQCAEKGKIGECYLKWANPIVFWTEEGDTYAIAPAGSGIQQERLDEAYGLAGGVYGQKVPGAQCVR